ncbi:MAG: hypothetical protein NT033_03655, partial [Candidatus Omnitrophica bacterium]|nr:hypothetical protein [Candidatus Omnitrophota bacterium]
MTRGAKDNYSESSVSLRNDTKWLKEIVCVMLFLSVIVLISYSNTLNNFFLDDDFTLLVKPFFTHNGSITHFIANRPIEFKPNIFAYFLWACIAKVFGASYFYHHLVAVVLHISAVYLFFLYIKRLSGNFRLAFYAAVLCASSYVCAEAVARVMHLQYPLVTACSLICLLLSLSRKPFYRIMSFIAFILALMSKEIALVVPFIMFFADFIFGGIRECYKKWKFYLLFFIVVISYLIIKFSHPQTFGSFGFLIRGKIPYSLFFKEHGFVSGIVMYCYKLVTIPLKYMLFSVNSFVFGGATLFLKIVLTLLITIPTVLFIKSGLRRFLTDKIILFAASWILLGSLPFFYLLFFIVV